MIGDGHRARSTMPNVHVSTALLASPEWLMTSPASRGHWICMLGYCARAENGGTVANAALWSDAQWALVLGPTGGRPSVDSLVLDGLAEWRGDDLLLGGYPTSAERTIQSQRAAGKRGKVQKVLRNGLPFCVFGLEPPCCDRGPVAIYVLIDPRDNTVRYVGKTLNPRARLKQHTFGRGNAERDSWVSELRSAGFAPRMEILEKVPISGWEAAERKWIEFYAIRGSVLNIEVGGRGPLPTATESSN